MEEERRDESRAAKGRKETRCQAEAETAETEARDGEKRFGPSEGLGCGVGSGAPKAEENGVALS